jgi:hypothetical protein
MLLQWNEQLCSIVFSNCIDAMTHTSTPGRPPPRVDTARATAAAAALSVVKTGTLKLTTHGTAPIVTTPAAGGALLGPTSGG